MFQELKLRYYRQLIELNLHHKQYLDVSKNYYEIYNTPVVKENDALWKDVSIKRCNFIGNQPWIYGGVLTAEGCVLPCWLLRDAYSPADCWGMRTPLLTAEGCVLPYFVGSQTSSVVSYFVGSQTSSAVSYIL